MPDGDAAPADLLHAPAVDDDTVASSPLGTRLLAVMSAARYNGVDLDRTDLRIPKGESLPPAALVNWVRGSGLMGAAACA